MYLPNGKDLHVFLNSHYLADIQRGGSVPADFSSPACNTLPKNFALHQHRPFSLPFRRAKPFPPSETLCSVLPPVSTLPGISCGWILLHSGLGRNPCPLPSILAIVASADKITALAVHSPWRGPLLEVTLTCFSADQLLVQRSLNPVKVGLVPVLSTTVFPGLNTVSISCMNE